MQAAVPKINKPQNKKIVSEVEFSTNLALPKLAQFSPLWDILSNRNTFEERLNTLNNEDQKLILFSLRELSNVRYTPLGAKLTKAITDSLSEDNNVNNQGITSLRRYLNPDPKNLGIFLNPTPDTSGGYHLLGTQRLQNGNPQMLAATEARLRIQARGLPNLVVSKQVLVGQDTNNEAQSSPRPISPETPQLTTESRLENYNLRMSSRPIFGDTSGTLYNSFDTAAASDQRKIFLKHFGVNNQNTRSNTPDSRLQVESPNSTLRLESPSSEKNFYSIQIAKLEQESQTPLQIMLEVESHLTQQYQEDLNPDPYLGFSSTSKSKRDQDLRLLTNHSAITGILSDPNRDIKSKFTILHRFIGENQTTLGEACEFYNRLLSVYKYQYDSSRTNSLGINEFGLEMNWRSSDSENKSLKGLGEYFNLNRLHIDQIIDLNLGVQNFCTDHSLKSSMTQYLAHRQAAVSLFVELFPLWNSNPNDLTLEEKSTDELKKCLIEVRAAENIGDNTDFNQKLKFFGNKLDQIINRRPNNGD